MNIAKGYSVWELRAKAGRKHLVIARWVFRDEDRWRVDWGAGRRPLGTMRWYRRRRGERWQAMTGWIKYE